MSQALKPAIKQCCADDPIWIFSYSDGSFFLICSKDFKNPSYQINLVECINIESQDSFTPGQLFGGSKVAKF